MNWMSAPARWISMIGIGILSLTTIPGIIAALRTLPESPGYNIGYLIGTTIVLYLWVYIPIKATHEYKTKKTKA